MKKTFIEIKKINLTASLIRQLEFASLKEILTFEVIGWVNWWHAGYPIRLILLRSGNRIVKTRFHIEAEEHPKYVYLGNAEQQITYHVKYRITYGVVKSVQFIDVDTEEEMKTLTSRLNQITLLAEEAGQLFY